MGVLKVKINGVWEEAVPLPLVEPPLDEVWTGQESPDPAGTYELWYDTNTEPGVLKAKRPNGAWEIASPDEVWVSPDQPAGITPELWVDTDDDSGLSSDEIWVGPTDPDIADPNTLREMWYDTDEVAPPGVSLGVTWWDATVAYPTGTYVAWPQADPSVWIAARDTVIGEEPGVVADAWTLAAGLNGPYLPLSGGTVTGPVSLTGGIGNLYHQHCYGPNGSAGSVFTLNLQAGTYLCMFAMTAVATATAIRYVNLLMDGAQINQSKFYFNQVNTHAMMNMGVTTVNVATTGDHDFTLVLSASLSIDVNDFGWMILIPAAA